MSVVTGSMQPFGGETASKIWQDPVVAAGEDLMTHAICIKCGAGKFGALSVCPDCHYEPVLNEDRARSMLLSDHHYPMFELDRIGEAIRGGRKVLYDPADILGYCEAMEIVESEDAEAGRPVQNATSPTLQGNRA